MKKKLNALHKLFLLSIVLSFSVQLVSFAGDIDASEDVDKLKNLNLEDIFNVPVKPEVTVASKKELTVNKSPGIITLISDKEIQNSGARDLLEVLQLIPGFVFNTDVEGAIGIGLRGLWAHEGKALLLLDGQELNDFIWPTTVFFNHIPVNHIKRIEVLRGPGSAIYGGQAELCVINIITKSADDINGFELSGTFGVIPTDFPDFTRRNISLSIGKSFGDFKISGHGLFGKGNISDRIYTDFSGNKYDMTGNNEMNPGLLNLSMEYKDFSARFLMDLYRRTSRDIFSLNVPDKFSAPSLLHDGYYAELKYDFHPFENVTITPKFNYKLQYPWYIADDNVRKITELEDFSTILFAKSGERYSGNVIINADFTDSFNLVAGEGFYFDKAQALDPLSANFGPDKNLSQITYSNMDAFAQALYKTDFGSLTLGARYENHSAYGASFVPRGAITLTLGDFHSKFLYSKAFKTPGVQNIINYTPTYSKGSGIKPENTTDIEFEAGYDFTSNISLKANLFDISIQDPIIYFVINDADAYDNFSRTGSRGAEVEFRLKDKKWGYANLSYSFSMANDNQVSVYEIPSRKDLLLGFPAHKAILSGSLKLTDSFSLNPSLIFFSNRFGYNSSKDDKPVLQEFSPTFLLNLNLLYKDLLFKGLDVSLGAYNLLNQTYYFIQPYDGSHAAFPGASTELFINAGYKFSLSDK